ncbi:NifB/NifX family molybdenum-iron cluster-binding protein, partial [bacterium]|nr:NifB/NifX family molybdenum-iron cluster-binding protein [bacterium]
MKICVTAQGNTLDSQVDPRFGRCQFFIIVDPESLQFEVVENASMGAASGAGIQSAQLIANKGAGVVLTGNCGPNAFQTLSAAGLKVIVGVAGTVREVVEGYKRGELQSTTEANVASKFGMGGGSGTPASPAVSADRQGGGAPGTGGGVGMGGGMGMGRGMGRGIGRGMGAGMGMPTSPPSPGTGFGMPAGQPSPAMPPSQLAPEDELRMLKDESEMLA